MSDPKNPNFTNDEYVPLAVGSHFAGKRPKLVLTSDADVEAAARDAKQTMRRSEAVKGAIENALINRVKGVTGPDVMHVTFDEFEKMRHDKEFEQLGKYSSNLLFYSDGVTPRPQPLRPLLENEVGMYRGKIVCVTNNPGDGSRGTIHGMTTPEEYKKAREAREAEADLTPEEREYAGRVFAVLKSELADVAGRENTPELQKEILERTVRVLEVQPDPFANNRPTFTVAGEEDE